MFAVSLVSDNALMAAENLHSVKNAKKKQSLEIYWIYWDVLEIGFIGNIHSFDLYHIIPLNLFVPCALLMLL